MQHDEVKQLRNRIAMYGGSVSTYIEEEGDDIIDDVVRVVELANAKQIPKSDLYYLNDVANKTWNALAADIGHKTHHDHVIAMAKNMGTLRQFMFTYDQFPEDLIGDDSPTAIAYGLN